MDLEECVQVHTNILSIDNADIVTYNLNSKIFYLFFLHTRSQM